MRRTVKSNSEFSLTKTTGDIARNRRFQKTSETSEAKRVRFDDGKTDASRGHEATQSPRCGAPKTSEYAYFRKVKDGAVNGRLRALHKERKQLKSPEVNYPRTETYKACEKLEASTEGLNFTVSGESTGLTGLKHFVSPPVRKYDESYKIRRKELTHKNKTRPPLLNELVTPVGKSLFLSPVDHGTEKSENQCIEKGFFSEKRKRLCQWIAHATSFEVEKFHGKGSDLISLLLSRVIPKGNENEDSSKGAAEDSNKSLIIHESDHVEKEPPQPPKIDCKEDLLKLPSETSSEIILREWESFDSCFPRRYRDEADLPSSHKIDCRMDLQNKAIDPDQSFETQRGFSFCLPFKSFRSFSPFHFKDLDKFGPIIRHGREDPNRHSLKWDFGFGKERFDHGARKDVCYRLDNTWNADQQMIVDNILNTKEFSPSPLFSSHYMFSPLPNYVSTDYLMHEVGPNLDDLECAMVEPRHYALTFPSSPNCIPLAEDENAENILSNSIIFSYRESRLPKKMIWDCKPRSEFLWKCLPAPEISADDHQFSQNENDPYSLPLLKEAPAEPGTSFCEGALDHSLLSSTLHSPVDAFMNCPLLLNHVSHDILDQELYFHDYDNEL